MKWTPGSRENIEDRRGQGGFGGGMRGGPMGIGVVVVLLVLTLLTGKNFLSLVDPGAVTGGGGEAPSGGTGPLETTPEEEKLVDFMDFVLGDNQQTWSQLLGGQYQSTTLVLFRQATSTSCGYGQSASGPFYCPGDGKVYLDLSFFDELHRRFGAPGDFAQAYVIAHEVGHHVQNLMGLERRVRQAQQQRPTPPTTCRSAWSCRPTAMPGSGGIRRPSAASSMSTTSTRDCARPHPSGTIASSVRVAAQ